METKIEDEPMSKGTDEEIASEITAETEIATEIIAEAVTDVATEVPLISKLKVDAMVFFLVDKYRLWCILRIKRLLNMLLKIGNA